MKLGIAINVTNKPHDLVENIRNWKCNFKTPTVISVFSNGIQLRVNGVFDFYGHKKQYRPKRIETPLTLVDAVRPLMDVSDLDFILWCHVDYFYLDEDILLSKLEEIKDKKLSGASHMDCPFCKNTSEFSGIKKTMGDVRCVSAYNMILTPEFIRKYDFLNMESFTSEKVSIENGGTAETFTSHFYKQVGEYWEDKILDLPQHGPHTNDAHYNSYFPDVAMVHSHMRKEVKELRRIFKLEDKICQ